MKNEKEIKTTEKNINSVTDNGKIELILIRHGRTKANDERRFLGSTDVSLSEDGIIKLNKRIDNGEYSAVDMLFSSPMKRCLETASIIYPDLNPVVIAELREINFGEFEGKNHQELDGRSDYQAYIDSNGTLPFPGGEDMNSYCEVVKIGLNRIREIAEENGVKRVAAVVHGGTVMATGSILGLSGYFEGIIGNGESRTVHL